MITVSAATGQLGRLIVAELLKQIPPSELSVSVRDPGKMQFAPGITVHQADYGDLAAMTRALQGIDQFIFIAGTALSEERIVQHRTVIQAAEKAGVRRVIYIGYLDVDPDSPFSFVRSHYETEQMLRASGLDWIFVRNGNYAEPLLESAQQALQTGVHTSAIRVGRASFITRRDIARTIAAIVTGEVAGHQIYPVTGAEALSQSELAALFSRLSGKEIVFQPITYEAFSEGLRQVGVPEPLVEAYTGFQRAVDMGNLALVSQCVEQLTGQPPESVESFLRRNLV